MHVGEKKINFILPETQQKNKSSLMKTSSGLEDMSVNTVRNQLEYIDLFIDGKKVKCLKDSGSELIILNLSLFPGKPFTGSIQIKSCFGNIIEAKTASLNLSLDGNQNMEFVRWSVNS
ncbi:hypothetical protein NPIL_463921 [Nephila pilipes]|uniref:Uncharacterized protein n=1 Tax=Nephila pilipes TaxID=299642 RepID=A0A8X6TY04_NEPPI|nr:hypothetical protein NPIL_463921 [Nephila pilipes]